MECGPDAPFMTPKKLASGTDDKFLKSSLTKLPFAPFTIKPTSLSQYLNMNKSLGFLSKLLGFPRFNPVGAESKLAPKSIRESELS
ncbi:MAG: hypothetical protein ACK56A_09660, partial [Bacteroidota bacterium]